jgi:hypothetical protein
MQVQPSAPEIHSFPGPQEQMSPLSELHDDLRLIPPGSETLWIRVKVRPGPRGSPESSPNRAALLLPAVMTTTPPRISNVANNLFIASPF